MNVTRISDRLRQMAKVEARVPIAAGAMLPNNGMSGALEARTTGSPASEPSGERSSQRSPEARG